MFGKVSGTIGRGGTRWRRSFFSEGANDEDRRAVRNGRIVSTGPGGPDQCNGRDERNGRAPARGRGGNGRAQRLRCDRGPHLSRHSVLQIVSEERCAYRDEGDQQSVLVERRR